VTQQLLRMHVYINVAKCRGDDPRSPEPCQFYADSGLFELCLAGDSQYVADGKQDWHTIQHMRSDGTCGEAWRFYMRIKKTT